jgi:hypothetical protein
MGNTGSDDIIFGPRTKPCLNLFSVAIHLDFSVYSVNEFVFQFVLEFLSITNKCALNNLRYIKEIRLRHTEVQLLYYIHLGIFRLRDKRLG